MPTTPRDPPSLLAGLSNESIPEWLQPLLAEAAVSPIAGLKGPARHPQLLKLLGEILTPSNPKRGVPRRIRLSALDPEKAEATLHEADTGQAFASSYDELGQLLSGKHLVKEGPDVQSVPTMIRKLLKILDQKAGGGGR